MKYLTTTIAVAMFATLVISAIASDASETTDSRGADQLGPNDDQVVASFERELNHQPAPATPPTREAIDNDILYETMNEIHWTSDTGNTAESSENKGDETADE